MNDITKKSYKELCGTLENTFRSDSYMAIAANAKGEAAKKIIMKDDGAIDISEASKTYSEIVKNELIPFLNTISLPKKEMDIIDIQEVSDVEAGHTLFGMAPITPEKPTPVVSEATPEVTPEVLEFKAPEVEKEEVKEAADQVMSINYDIENTTMIPDISTTPIYKNEEEDLPEVATIENAKVKQLGKKAAYVDTVILCLIAQLSIFGLLILVLLIMK